MHRNPQKYRIPLTFRVGVFVMGQVIFFAAAVVMPSGVMRKVLSLQKSQVSQPGNAIAYITRLKEGFLSDSFLKRRQTSG
jgi:hypothetical protein